LSRLGREKRGGKGGALCNNISRMLRLPRGGGGSIHRGGKKGNTAVTLGGKRGEKEETIMPRKGGLSGPVGRSTVR